MIAVPQTVNRIETLREALRNTGVDVLICFKPENTFYLSGFNPIIYSHPVITIMPVNGEPTLLIHALRDDHAKMSSMISDVRLYGAWSTKVTMGLSWVKALHTILEERGLLKSVIGFEGDYLPVARLNDLKSIAPATEFKDASSSIFHSRVIKDPDEIANARIAAAIADRGMDRAIDTLGAGGSERDVAVEAMYAMNKEWIASYPDVEVGAFGSLEGGVQNALWCWCLSGKRVLINCDAPSNRKPEQGEVTLIYIWAAANGMYVENERSVAIGHLAPEQQKAFDCVLRARAEAQPLIRPGEPIAEIFHAIKASYERSGFGKYIPGRIGHGMGLGAHEEPSLDGKTQLLFRPGMMFTFEPNLRIPEWGGLQHSDTLLITDTGHESLTKTPNGFLQVRA